MPGYTTLLAKRSTSSKKYVYFSIWEKITCARLQNSVFVYLDCCTTTTTTQPALTIQTKSSVGWENWIINFLQYYLIYRGTREQGIWTLGPPRGWLMGGGCQAWSETYPVPVPSLGKAPRLRYQPFSPALLLLALFHELPWYSMEFSWYQRSYFGGKIQNGVSGNS